MKLVPDTQTRMYVVIFFALLLLCSCLGRPYQIQTAGESIDTGRVVLLIHGLGSSPKIWTPAIQDLVGNAFSAPVVTFQYPSGILAKKNVDPNPKVAHTLRRFLQTRSLRNKKFVIIAHSNGSLVALNYISQFHSDHRVEALALLAPPMFGSKVADLLDPLPDNLVGTQSGALRFLNPDLIELHARIHKTRKYFPKTFVALGSNDKLAVVETGALPYRFARNYKFPLNHSQLRELDKQPELMQLLKDFVDGTPAPSTITSTDAPSQLLLRIPNLMQLVFYQNGYIRKEPSDESLSKQGFVPFEPPSWDSITDQKGGLTFADLERTARNLESTQIQVPLRIGIQKCANGNCATELIDVKQEKKELKRKYDLSFAVRKSPSQILWVSSLSAANKSAREKNGDYLPWGEEFNFMTWEQVQKELADDGVQSALQIEQFDPDVNGPEQIHFRHHLAGVLRKAFAYKRVVDTKESYILYDVTPGFEVIGKELLLISELPAKRYHINLSNTLKMAMKDHNYHGTNFERWIGSPFKEIVFDVRVQGPGIQVRELDFDHCQINPQDCLDPILNTTTLARGNIVEAINNKDVALAKSLISSGANLNEKRQSGSSVRSQGGQTIKTPIMRTPLEAAINTKLEDLAIYLLKKGADPRITASIKSDDLLAEACRNELFRFVEELLAGYDIGVPENKKRIGRTMPMFIASNGNRRLMEIVSQNGINWAAVDNYGENILVHASRNRNSGPLLFLLEHQPTLPQDAKTVNFFLRNIMQVHSPKVLDIVLNECSIDLKGLSTKSEHRGFANCVNFYDESRANHMLSLLFKHGLPVESPNQIPSFLMNAAKVGARESFHWLVEQGADIHALDKHGRNLLFYAAGAKLPDIAQWLMRHGVSAKVVDHRGETVLFNTARWGSSTVARMLISAGVDFKHRSNLGLTAFNFATRLGNQEMMLFLLKQGVNVNSRSKNGRTPLMDAAAFSNDNTVGLLLSHGADKQLRDNRGKNALDIAQERNRRTIVALLESKN